MSNIMGYIAGAAADQLKKTCGCTLKEAEAVVSLTCGNLVKQATYGDLRVEGASHDVALSWVRQPTDQAMPEDPDRQLKHLLACIGEECGEVQQLVGKSLRFGIQDHHPETAAQNWAELVNEVHDLVAVYELLCMRMGQSIEFNRDKMRAKQHKTVELMHDYGVIK